MKKAILISLVSVLFSPLTFASQISCESTIEFQAKMSFYSRLTGNYLDMETLKKVYEDGSVVSYDAIVSGPSGETYVLIDADKVMNSCTNVKFSFPGSDDIDSEIDEDCLNLGGTLDNIPAKCR